MGKGEVNSHLGEAKYNLKVKYNTERYQSIIDNLNQKITEWEEKITEKESEIAQARIDGNTKKVIDLTVELDILKLQKTAFEKRIETIEKYQPVDYNSNVWCSDYTKDITGEVGTVEVPGEVGTILIRPGYVKPPTLSGADWNEARDGQLTGTYTQTAAGAYYNLAMLPGWQKWNPQYRFGTITTIDHDLNKVDIDLEDIKSSQQDITINQTTTLSGVTVQYMDCNSMAFEVGDEVLIEFTNRSWSHPKVIGFKEEPTACQNSLLVVKGNPEEYLDISLIDSTNFIDGESVTCDDGGNGNISKATSTRLYGQFLLCWENVIHGDSSGAKATISAAYEKYFERTYSTKEIFESYYANFPNFLEIVSPIEVFPMSQVPSGQGIVTAGRKTWFKTLDDVVFCAFTHYPAGLIGPLSEKWSVAISYKNNIISWKPYGGNYFPESGYMRATCKNSSACIEAEHFTDTHIGFDLWEDSGEYYVGIISDQNETLRVFKLNKDTLTMEFQWQYQSQVRSTYWDEEEGDAPYAWVRLIGYGYSGGENYTYWCALERSYIYYKENMNTGDITEYDLGDYSSLHPGYISDALWNPITKTVHFCLESLGGTEISAYSEDYERCSYIQWYRVGLSDQWDCEGNVTQQSSQPIGAITVSLSQSVYLASQDVYLWCTPVAPEITTYNRDWYIGNEIVKARGDTYNYGRFLFNTTDVDKGVYHLYNENVTRWRVRIAQGVTPKTCDNANPLQFNDGRYTTLNICEPEDAKDYRFKEWVFQPTGGVAGSYEWVNMVKTPNCVGRASTCTRECETWNEYCGDDPCYIQFPGPTECECLEYKWRDTEVGITDIRRAASDKFPYDYNWKAILIKGVGRVDGDDLGLPTVLHENYVIYQDKDTSELFMATDNGSIETIGNYERVFFKQMPT